MVTIDVNGRALAAEPGATILAVLKKHNIRVPSLCNMDELRPTGSCRLCVVELENPHKIGAELLLSGSGGNAHSYSLAVGTRNA